MRLRQVAELAGEVPDAADDAFFVDVLLNFAWVLYFRIDMGGIIELLEPSGARQGPWRSAASVAAIV